jgi:hypothetical protein
MLKIKTFILPAHFASYLINGDASSLNVTEVDEIEDFMEKRNLYDCIDCSEDSWFAWVNDMNYIGGDVMRFTFNAVE